MSELVAGVLVAAAALAFVLEPLARRESSPPAGAEPAHEPRADLLIRQMRARLMSRCPSCEAAAEPGSVYCANCGTALIRGD
ncbi:MAG: hypothetical protein HY700_03400 [Gemmatimonadetes bacterium]|nr:hypothetical protein [Gemmatimonadota bacterium]